MSPPGTRSFQPALGLGLALALLTALFFEPLWALARHALTSATDSYIPVVPFLAAGYVAVRRRSLPPPGRPDLRLAIGLGLLGALAVGISLFRPVSQPAALSLRTLGFVAAVAALCAAFLGRQRTTALAFPLAFLLFLIPVPVQLLASIEHGLEWASSAVAAAFFSVSSVPVLRQGALAFRIPGVTLYVAPECSGIRSSLALFILSWPTAFLFIRPGWRRAAFIVSVLPIGILRNGFRIFVIGALCAHFGPQMVDSYVHRHGGWIFFLLSLLPLAALLRWLAGPESSCPRSDITDPP